MNKINKIWNGVVFRKILIIFIVGLVSRSVVNLVFEVNVFKDYTILISLTYYAFMACFTGFVGELPSISFSVFDITFVRSAIRSFCQNTDISRNKAVVGMITDNGDKVSGLPTDNFTHYFVRRPSAGVVGLYGWDNSRVNVAEYVPKHSIGNKLRCKILWHSLIKYAGECATYKEYVNSLDPRYKVSIVDEYRKNREIKRNK
jgi:hypothetical protein